MAISPMTSRWWKARMTTKNSIPPKIDPSQPGLPEGTDLAASLLVRSRLNASIVSVKPASPLVGRIMQMDLQVA